MMNYTIKTEPHEGYLQITATGAIADLDEYKCLNIEYADIIAEHGAEKILVDENGLQKPDSLLDIIDLVASYTKDIAYDARGWKIALVVRPVFEEVARFWELQAREQGYNAAVFTDRDAALGFLAAA